MRKLPPVIRDNLILISCVGASLSLHAGMFLAKRGVEHWLLIPVVPVQSLASASGLPMQDKPDGTPAAPAPARPLENGKKTEEKPLPPKPEQPKAEPKPPPPRVEKKSEPQAAKPPAKANPGRADLLPVKIEAPEPMGVDMGQLIRIRMENAGTEPAGPHRDALFFSTNGRLDRASVPLGVMDVQGGLAPGAQAWERTQILLPDKTPSGRAYLVVVLNADGRMPETNHANNQMVVPIMVDAESVPLGSPDERPRTTVAWIESKDFRKLKARQSSTLQPAVQNDSKTTPDARPDVLAGAKDAPSIDKIAAPGQSPEKPSKRTEPSEGKVAVTPPKAAVAAKPEPPSETNPPTQTPSKPAAGKPAMAAAAEPARPEVKPVAAPKPPDEGVARVAPPKSEVRQPDVFKPLPGQPADPKAPVLALTMPGKTPVPALPRPAAPASPTPVQPGTQAVPPGGKPESKHEEPAPPKPASPPQTPASQPGDGATSAPADESSAVPTQLDESDLQPQPGRVLVGRGVRIRTARMRMPSRAARDFDTAVNPRVAVTFNAKGEPIKVQMLRSSGDAEWDAVVIESMYRWHAEGEQVAKGNLVVRWTILITDR